MQQTHSLKAFSDALRQRIEAWKPGLETHFGDFEQLATELFQLQFQENGAYRRICEAQGIRTPRSVGFDSIPFIPTSAFKELELTSLPPEQRRTVFHSSGTSGHIPSRHFHSVESVSLYESSLWGWFRARHPVVPGMQMIALTPGPDGAPHSSLVHMFSVLNERVSQNSGAFLGGLDAEGNWVLDAARAMQELTSCASPVLLLGTAFLFVHFVDYLGTKGVRLRLPPGSVALETGGYKGRSRMVERSELHGLMCTKLGIPSNALISEYGMSELSSQAYDFVSAKDASRVMRFPPWARVQIVSPEDGKEVSVGETGLIRVLDLANVFSVAAVQTEDLGVRREHGFELIGRAFDAEPRGCSRMSL